MLIIQLDYVSKSVLLLKTHMEIIQHGNVYLNVHSPMLLIQITLLWCVFQFVHNILNIMLNNIAAGVSHYAYQQLQHIQEVLLIIQQENVLKPVLKNQIIILITLPEDVYYIALNNLSLLQIILQDGVLQLALHLLIYMVILKP